MADDFCTFSLIDNAGFMSALRTNLGTRYSASVFSYGLATLGEQVVQYIVFVFFALLIVILVAVFFIYKNRKSWQLVVSAVVISELFFLALFYLTPNRKESLFWFGASVVYVWPVIFIGIAYILFNIKSGPRIKYFLWPIALALLFFSFGFNETLSFATLPILGCLIIYKLFVKSKNLLPYFLVTLTNIIAILTMFFLPARLERVEMLESIGVTYSPGVVQILVTTAKGTLLFFWHMFASVGHLLFVFIFASLAFSLFHYIYERSLLKKAQNPVHCLILLFTLPVSVYFSLIPGYYVFSDGPPTRALVVPTYITLIYIIIFTALLAQFNYKSWKFNYKQHKNLLLAVAFVVVLFLSTLTTAFVLRQNNGNGSLARSVKYLEANQEAAENYDQRRESIYKEKTLGNLNLVVPPIVDDKVPESNFSEDPGHWINICAADYYNISSFKLKN